MVTPTLFSHRSSLFSGYMWLVVLFPMLAAIIPLIFTVQSQGWGEVWPAFVILALSLGMIAFIRLEYRVLAQQFRFRFLPFTGWKSLDFVDYAEARLMKINAMKEFGGWGLRYGRRLGKAYTSHGSYIVHFEPKIQSTASAFKSWKPGNPVNFTCNQEELNALESALKTAGMLVVREC
ncbi:MAG: hypothetical protein ACO3DK_01985 [Bacteroidia bacterium]